MREKVMKNKNKVSPCYVLRKKVNNGGKENKQESKMLLRHGHVG